MDINIWGIGLNDALCPNNHVLEEFENSLCTGVESVISGYRDWETDRKSTRLNSSH